MQLQLYVVLVTRKDVGGYRHVASPIIVTENPAVALTAAFGVEEKGYFIGYDDGIAIFRILSEVTYPPESFDLGGHPQTNVVFTRTRSMHNKSGWVESWHSAELEVTYRRIFDTATT